MAFHLRTRICKFCNDQFQPLVHNQIFCNYTCRFLTKIKIGTGTECWHWLGWKTPGGYGRFGFENKNWIVTRLMWSSFYGYLPDEILVLHRCDNPSCVNPSHLFLGTIQDNIADCVAKNRHAKGEKKPFAKLNPKQVLAIRKELSEGVKYGSLPILAAKYGVTAQTISNVNSGRTWSHI